MSSVNLPPHLFVRDAHSWATCLSHIQRVNQLAIDLESNSLYAYKERICLIQLSTREQDFIVDPFSDINLAPLGDIMADEHVEKVFHAAEYDLILMSREHSWTVSNLFDTMWAARILGIERIGLANMLGDRYGLKLDKKFQRANWSERPLSAEMLAYAQSDTHFLLRLRDDLYSSLDELGRLDEAHELFAEQCDVTIPDTSFSEHALWQFDGVNEMSNRKRAILWQLLVYRDKKAQKQDRPLFKVFSDRTLRELVERQPRSQYQLRDIHGMSHSQIRRYGRDILRQIESSRNKPYPSRPRNTHKRPTDDVLERYDKLREWRKVTAVKRGVPSDVILSRNSLWELARINPTSTEQLATVASLGPWRKQTYGAALIDLLQNGA